MTPRAPTVRWDTSPGQARDAGAALGRRPIAVRPIGALGTFGGPEFPREEVRLYIQEQETHHRTVSFQEEFRAFLARYEVEYDERYIWD